MISSKHISTVLLALVLLGAATPLAAGAINSQPADLFVEEPEYADGQVDTKSANGTPVYVVQGASVDIHPQNFNSSDVVDFGKKEQAGSLTYNENTGEFELTLNRTGSYHLYWIVTREMQVTQNNTTTTQQVSMRYEAIVRCTERCNVVVESPSADAKQEQAASKWNSLVSRLKELGLLESGDNVDVVISQMVSAYRFFAQPFQMFSGSITQILTMLIITRGGNLLLALGLFAVGGTVYGFASEALGYKIFEAEEGDLSRRITAAEAEERRRILQNTLIGEVVQDHVAAYWREEWDAETLWEAWQVIQSVLTPGEVVRDILADMEANGWRAVVARDGDDVESVEMVRESEADDVDGTVKRPSNLDEDEFDVLDKSCEAIRTYDITDSDLEYDEQFEVMDYEEILDRFEVDTRRIDGDVFARELAKMTETVRQHPYTDEQGYTRGYRAAMNALLNIEQQVADKYGIPTAAYTSEAIQRAIVDKNPEDDADRTVERIKQGVHDSQTSAGD